MGNVLTEMVEGVADARLAALNSATALNRIATRTRGLLVRQQLRALERCLEAGSRQLQLAAEVREPKDLLVRQTEIAKQLGEQLLAAAQEGLELQAQVRSELAHWAEDGLESTRTPPAKIVPGRKPKATLRAAHKAA